MKKLVLALFLCAGFGQQSANADDSVCPKGCASTLAIVLLPPLVIAAAGVGMMLGAGRDPFVSGEYDCCKNGNIDFFCCGYVPVNGTSTLACDPRNPSIGCSSTLPNKLCQNTSQPGTYFRPESCGTDGNSALFWSGVGVTILAGPVFLLLALFTKDKEIPPARILH